MGIENGEAEDFDQLAEDKADLRELIGRARELVIRKRRDLVPPDYESTIDKSAYIGEATIRLNTLEASCIAAEKLLAAPKPSLREARNMRSLLNQEVEDLRQLLGDL